MKCIWCKKSLANNDDAENHAGECIVMNFSEPCQNCDGMGRYNMTEIGNAFRHGDEECKVCDGKGYVLPRHLTSGSTATSLSAVANVAAKSESTGANNRPGNNPAGA